MYILGLKNPKSMEMYMEINPLVEELSTIFYYGTMNVLYPSEMFSKFIFSYFVYFTKDGQNKVFELPYPFW